MDVLNSTKNISEIVHMLRTRLAPVGQAETLVDTVEGRQPGARKAAVLLPLFISQGELALAFIRRSSSLRAHSGEIAFPGGKVEGSDSSLMMTALRETREEIGLDTTRLEILGALPPVFTVVSNYLIAPIVAFLPAGLGTLCLQESEVSELIVAPLRTLADPAIVRTEQWTRDNKVRTVYFYDYQRYCIWGATGRILTAFLNVLKQEDTYGV